MSTEKKLTAIVLKKQPFNEADEIITFYSLEAGKVRGIAKSVKLAKSKLQAKLQSLFLVDLTLAGKNLPKIISVETKEVFSNLRENYNTTIQAIYAGELVMKFSADEEPNQSLYNLLVNFLNYLNSHFENGQNSFEQEMDGEIQLAKFKIGFLQAIGFGLNAETLEKEFERAGLNLSDDSRKIFAKLKTDQTFTDVLAVNVFNHQLASFIEHQLERKIKSTSFLV